MFIEHLARSVVHAATIATAVLLLGGCGSLPTRDAAADSAAMRTTPENYVVVAVDNPVQNGAQRAGSTIRGYDTVGIYAAGTVARNLLNEIALDYQLKEVAAWPINALRWHCVVFRVAPGTERDTLLDRLAHDGRIKLAQPLQSFATMSSDYNDPYLSLQSGFDAIDGADAHRWSRGDGVRVAVIDTGVDVHHPDLKGRISGMRNFVDDDATRFAADRHGTEVAGVIAAVANNGQGIVGVAPGVSVVALKACWQLRIDSADARCNSFTLAQALAAAIDARADIVNISIAGPPDPLLDTLIVRGAERGMIFVGAVGPNNGANQFPVSTRGVLAVDAAERPSGIPRALPAPGSDILTLTPSGHYDFASGSSLATAHVSGVVALLLAQNKGLNAQGVGELLRASESNQVLAGKSRLVVNACNALAKLRPRDQCRAGLGTSKIAAN